MAPALLSEVWLEKAVPFAVIPKDFHFCWNTHQIQKNIVFIQACF